MSPPAAAVTAIAIIIILLLPFVSQLQAQPTSGDGGPFGGLLIGPAAAYEVGVPLTRERAADASAICNCDGAGESYGSTIQGGAELIAPSFFGGGFGLGLRLTLGASEGNFISAPYDYRNGLEAWRNRFYVDATARSIGGELLADLAMRNGVAIALGPAIDYRYGGRFVRTEEVMSPSGARFASSGSSARVIDSGEGLGASKVVPTLVLRASYRVPLASFLLLRPSLHARLDVGALGNGGGLSSMSFGAGLALLVAPGGTNEEIPLSPPVPLSPPAASSRPFAATLDIYGFDEAGNESQTLGVLRRRLRQRQYTPFMPVFYFDRGSAALPARYVRYGGDAARRFSIDSLARRDARAIYYQGLNVLGFRLRSNPGAIATLVGDSGPGEGEPLALERAATVRRYLAESWGIDSARITLRTRKGRGAGGERSVTLAESSPMIAGVIRTEWLVQELHAPEVGLDPGFEGGRGVRRWDIGIRQGGREVAHYSSDAREENRELDFSMVTMENGDEARPAPLVAELIAEDSSGALAAARDQLPLVIRDDPRDAAGGGERLRTAYLFYPGDSIAERNDGAMLASLGLALKEAGQITITYPKDGGSRPSPRARRLAGRLDELLGELGIRAEKVGVASQGAPEAPRLPEDRILVSQVSLVIESAANR